MKILPPLRNWLPALLKSRTAQGLAATTLVLAAGLLILLDRTDMPETAAATRGKPADMTATYEPAATTCSGLALDRSHHAVVKETCPSAAIRAGESITANRPLPRKPMPPRANELTPADRAISVPESLRTSVWDVGIAPNKAGAGAPPPTIISGETVKP
jgi:hypothetical protein